MQSAAIKFRDRMAIAAAALCLAAVFSGCSTNPVTGEDQFLLVGPKQELQLGHSYHPNIVFMYDGEYQDPELKRYLGTIVKRLHQVSHRPGMPVDFTIVNTSMINAFAIPGHVYCTRGLLAEFENEAQFAAIMGHELGHVAARHTARQMTSNMLLGIGALAAGAALEDEENAQMMITAGLLGVQVLNLSYSREQEHQADRLGAYYMALAGWDPRQAIASQRLIEGLSDHKPNFISKYLSTHPQADDRVGEIEDLIAEKGLLADAHIQGDGIYAGRWQRRLAGLVADDRAFESYDHGVNALGSGDHRQALLDAEQAIAASPSQAPFFRLKGDALRAMKRYGEADTAYRRALQLDQRYIPAVAGRGELALARRDYGRAEQYFRTAVKGYPTGLPGLWGLGQSLYRQSKYREARATLEEVVKTTNGKLRGSCYMLAVCYDRLGKLNPASSLYKAALANGIAGQEKLHAQKRAKEIDAWLKEQAEKQAEQKKNSS